MTSVHNLRSPTTAFVRAWAGRSSQLFCIRLTSGVQVTTELESWEDAGLGDKVRDLEDSFSLVCY